MDYDTEELRAAIEERHSVRKYTGEPIPADVSAQLKDFVAACAEESGLVMELIEDDRDAFRGLMGRMVGFAGSPAYIAIAGPSDDPPMERAGYYGELAVLKAQSLGLNTCWAMICSHKRMESTLPSGMKMIIGIAVGIGADQGKPHKDKPVEKVCDPDDIRMWYMRGVQAAMKAPTAMNKQAFRIDVDGDRVSVVNTGGRINRIDAGIVRLHFELGAGKDKFEWADTI